MRKMSVEKKRWRKLQHVCTFMEPRQGEDDSDEDADDDDNRGGETNSLR